MFKKISLPILLTVMAVLIFVVVMLYRMSTGQIKFGIKKNGNQGTVVTKEETKIVRTDYTEVARKTLDWVDKQRNDKGWYILGKVCGQNDCEVVWDDAEVGNKDGLIATWARLNFYEQHKEAKDIEIVKKDIDSFYEKYKEDKLKDSLWICKITYEMAQSKYIDKGQKDKLKELCVNKEIVSFDKSSWEKEKEKVAEERFGWLGGKVNFSYFNLVFEDLYYGFGNISDSFYKFKFTNEEKYLRLAKENLLNIENAIKDGNVGLSNKCILGIGSLDLYKFSKSKNDLDKAVGIYEQIKEDEEVATDPFCGLLGENLYNIGMDSKYLIDLEKNNKKIVEENYDEAGFFRLGVEVLPYRAVVKNSLFVELIK